ncbi:serpin (serine protease inhibitor) domain-containing protein [Phthorimaea operculella]|nr:serpin (serine protease inhibitor) domain-containing protein [Phthorimaea operculella]
MKAALGKLYKTKVKVFLPRMEINADFELIPILQKLGIINIFDAGKSDIRNILKKFEPLYVTAAKQKAFFQCNEQGTEAAAATAIVGGATSSIDPPPEKPTVRCDHPFLFIIYIKKYPVFIGANLIDK